MSNPSGQHVREHRSVLASLEARTLRWIAHRLPDAITSDALSALGLASMAAAGVAFAAFRWTPWAAAVVVAALAANWFGDSLDGTVARVRNQQRPRYGFYLDHVIDLAGTTCLLAGIGISGLMHPLLAAALLAAYFLVSAETYLATHSAGVFRMSFVGVGPTELRLLLAIGALKAATGPLVSIGGYDAVRLFDVAAVIAIAGLAIAFAVSAWRNARALYLLEPLPVRADASRAA
jgi:phosphatidylglycerophosphate synthase